MPLASHLPAIGRLEEALKIRDSNLGSASWRGQASLNLNPRLKMAGKPAHATPLLLVQLRYPKLV